jgi:hypothetical protein
VTAKLDLAVVDRNANTVSLLHGDGSGGFTPMSGSPIATNSQPFSVILRRAQGHVLAVGDLNGDGKPDLVAVDQFGNAISTFLNMFTYPPAAPTAVNAVAGDGQASVSFGIPARDGGAAVTSYQVTASPGGATATGSGSPLTVTGLTNGTAYTFTITATNSAGTGAASPASSPVIPSAPAAAPTGTSVLSGLDTKPPTNPSGLTGRLSGRMLVLTWTPASDDTGVDHYVLYRDGVAVATLSGSATQDLITAGLGGYSLRAFDAAGNVGSTAGPVALTKVKRPAGLLRRIPVWSWKLLVSERAGGLGTRPTAPKLLPAWFARWASWRSKLLSVG